MEKGKLPKALLAARCDRSPKWLGPDWLVMIIWMSGPTGAGKSSLAKIFSTVGYTIIKEEIPTALFHMFALDPRNYCAPLQEAIIRSRFARWSSRLNQKFVVFDRSINEDFHVFCRMHFELGNLDHREFDHLRDLTHDIEASMPTPDLVIYMTASHKALMQRISKGTHPPIIVSSIDRQICMYSSWISSRSEEVLHVDNTACSLRNVQRVFQRPS